VDLANEHPATGSGLWGDLPAPMEEKAFLAMLKQQFACRSIRHTALAARPVKKGSHLRGRR